MRGLGPDSYFASTRVRTTSSDENGNTKVGLGMGFWMRGRTRSVLVTNKHNLDPALKFPMLVGWKLWSLEIDLREFVAADQARRTTRMFRVEDLSAVHVHDSAVCAVVVAPRFADAEPKYRWPP